MPRHHFGPGRAPGQPLALNLEHLEERTLLSASTSLLVTFNSGVNVTVGEQVVAGTTVTQAVGSTPGLYVVSVASGVNANTALTALQADPAVASAEVNSTLSVSSIPTVSSSQYGLTTISASSAWTTTTGSYSTVVAVADTGIDYDDSDLYENIWLNNAEIPRIPFTTAFDQAHNLPLGSSRYSILTDVLHDGSITFADLNNPVNQGPGKITDLNGDGRIDAADILEPMVTTTAAQAGQHATLYDTGAGGWAYTGNTQDGDLAHPNDFIGWNFVNNTNNPLDDNDHGTNVAGIIGAQGTAGSVDGVDPTISLMDLKFIASDGTGSLSDYIEALDYAIQHGARIVNNSWSGAPDSTDLYNAIVSAQQNGMIFVAAAGNYSVDTDTTPYYPGSFTLPNVVTVAALTSTGTLASFSDYGAKTVDVGAPGVNIESTLPNGQYGEMSGTSQATPFATGVLALVWSEYPTMSYQQVISDVEASVTPIAALKGKSVTGGEVNAAAALKLAAPQVVPPVALNAVNLGGSTSITTIQVTFDQVMDPPSFALVNAMLTTPAGLVLNPTSITAVVGSGNKVFNFVFATQVANGTYALGLSTTIRNAQGTRLVNGYAQNFVVSHPMTYTSTTALSIPADSTVTSSLVVPDTFTITNATVTLNITGNYDGALFIYLQSPTGTKVYLVNDVGGSGKNFTNTVLADTAAKSITTGSAPFTGTFQPESALAALNGLQAKGTWKLVIQDTIPSTSGQLVNWTLTFNTSGSTISTQSDSQTLGIASYVPVGSGTQVAAAILTAGGGSATSSSPQGASSQRAPARVSALDQLFASAPTLAGNTVYDLALLAGGSDDKPSTASEALDELVFNIDE